MRCCICNRPIEREDAPVLTYSAFGQPRALCDRCDDCLGALTRAKEPERIRAAMAELTERRQGMDERDRLSHMTLSRLVEGAAERLSAIEAGTFDFAAEEEADLVSEQIPEELQETEEDREEQTSREERERRSDRIFSYVWAAVMVVALAAMIYLFVLR